MPALPAGSRRARWRVVLSRLGVLAGLAALLLVFRAPLLRGVANGWVINDPLEQADAIALLAQASPMPMLESARLYREGFAPKVIFFDHGPMPTDRIGVTTPGEIATRQALIAHGVPDSAIVTRTNLPSLHAAVLSLRDWVRANSARRVLAVTEQFHTRRVDWCMERFIRPEGVRVCIRATPVQDYPLTEWWRHEQGLIQFENEVVLNLFYRLNY